ncbi:Protein kinase protein rad53 [Kalmusia sp. IMI 367209]|nr:Protein kinase protein rad53 [Kalmusia sp. IMI 367209]
MDSSQNATQPVLDPRRLGRDNSGLDDDESTDIMVILVAGSPAATRIVEQTALTRDYHVLFHDSISSHDIEEQETIIIGEGGTIPDSTRSHVQRPADIALRFSSINHLKQKYSGFVFGRNAAMSDVVFGQDTSKRISNQHFRIYLNSEGLIMLEDLSTNGTRVDNIILKSKDPKCPKSRVLVTNTEIIIANVNDNEMIRFIVRQPPRGPREQIDRFEQNRQIFMSQCLRGEEREKVLRLQQQPYRQAMKWNGGIDYTIMGELGKGAFATVYKIATKMNGVVFAAKELEKRRFMKDGHLDKKLDNELAIMRNLQHPNVIQFVDYHDEGDHLYIIMEYARYGDLRKHLEQCGSISEKMCRSLAQQVLSALAHLHSQKVTHRDIKPDNILISELEPLEVKISDFGLSKMVRHEETFLKTFCGTLLYCAPEVFPFHTRTKKRRRGMNSAYSSACDIWSLGGVLWNALCGEPPFEGKQDATGEAMYNHIMDKALNVSPLKAKNISDECIDLLTRMLRKDPLKRPTEIECLLHPWLKDGAIIPQDPALQSIVEEDESDAEHKLSQLSLQEDMAESAEEDDVLSDEEFERLIDARQSKRIRTDPLFPRYQLRDHEDQSSAAASFQSERSINQMANEVEESFQPMPKATHRLFGEIGQSALESSGVLNVHANQALSNAGSTDSGAQQERNGTRQAPTRQIPTLNSHVSSSSLFGAESLVRELNMASPQSLGSGQQSPNEPATPKTPDVPQHNSLGYSPKDPSQNSEPTPRARPPTQNRLISLPKTPSFFYDPADPTTHNIEYAQKVSGYDFGVSREQDTTAGASALEDTMHQSGPTKDLEASGVSTELFPDMANPELPTEPDIKAPPRRVGKLTATSDSFDPSLVLNIDQRNTSWGRLKTHTIVYEDSSDTRIPKTAFHIFWWSPSGVDVQELSQNGQDWTSTQDLHVGIFTSATSGLSVNGKHIRQRDDKGRAIFGNLHSGDIIQVYYNPKTSECLKFKCEFYVGAGKEPRPAGESFKVLYGAKIS